VKEDPVQRAVETVFLFHALMALIRCDGDQQRREVEVAVHVVRRRNRQSGRVANDFVERARAEESEYSRTSSAMNSKKFSTNSGRQ